MMKPKREYFTHKKRACKLQALFYVYTIRLFRNAEFADCSAFVCNEFDRISTAL